MNKRLLLAGLLAVASFSLGVKADDVPVASSDDKTGATSTESSDGKTDDKTGTTPAEKVSMSDRLKGFGTSVAAGVKKALDCPANVLFSDESIIAGKTHKNVAFAARLGLAGYVVYTVSQKQKVKELWGKVTARCKNRK